jgi:hypothetical protein
MNGTLFTATESPTYPVPSLILAAYPRQTYHSAKDEARGTHSPDIRRSEIIKSEDDVYNNENPYGLSHAEPSAV